jgi:hypothetical protein
VVEKEWLKKWSGLAGDGEEKKARWVSVIKAGRKFANPKGTCAAWLGSSVCLVRTRKRK